MALPLLPGQGAAGVFAGPAIVRPLPAGGECRSARLPGPNDPLVRWFASDQHDGGDAEVDEQREQDLRLLADLDAQVTEAEARIAALIPATRYQVPTSGPGWGTARVGAYAAAVGDPARWGSHAKIYRAAGLTPAQYESAGRRRDGGISREGSVELRRALLDLGVGLWHRDPPLAPTPLGCASAASPAASSPPP